MLWVLSLDSNSSRQDIFVTLSPNYMLLVAQQMENGSISLCLWVTKVHIDAKWFIAYI